MNPCTLRGNEIGHIAGFLVQQRRWLVAGCCSAAAGEDLGNRKNERKMFPPLPRGTGRGTKENAAGIMERGGNAAKPEELFFPPRQKEEGIEEKWARPRWQLWLTALLISNYRAFFQFVTITDVSRDISEYFRWYSKKLDCCYRG